MTVRSRDFISVAEDIRSHELSARGQIENLKGKISELSGRKDSLDNRILYLEAAIAAAYEDIDEDGDPDYDLIASLEVEKSSAESELTDIENEVYFTGNELADKQNELEKVEEEKAQTLFEIQERARKTSNNINLAGGMQGAYASAGGALQRSLQMSFASLNKAAGILGDSINGISGENYGTISGSKNAVSREVGVDIKVDSQGTSSLLAFTGQYEGEVLTPESQFSTTQDLISTPATMLNYHLNENSADANELQNFSTEQDANRYSLSSFGAVIEEPIVSQSVDAYKSNQVSQNMKCRFETSDFSVQELNFSDSESRESMTEYYMKFSESVYMIGDKTRKGANAFFEKIFSNMKTQVSTFKAIPFAKRYELLGGIDTGNISKESLRALTSLSADVLKKNFGNVFPVSRFKEIKKNIRVLSEEEIKKDYPDARSNAAGFYRSKTREIIIKKDAQVPIGRFLHTYIHEMLHKLSHGNGKVGLVEECLDQDEKIIKYRGLNEGITDLYACRVTESVMNNEFFARGYPIEISIVERIESIYGKKELLDVFVNGEIDKLRKDFDFCFARNGEFDTFAKLVDKINFLTSICGKTRSSPGVARKVSAVLKKLDEYEKLKKDPTYRYRKHLATEVNNTSTNLSGCPKDGAPQIDPRELAVWEKKEELNR